eukprot:scpid71149/ scgid9757/ 
MAAAAATGLLIWLIVVSATVVPDQVGASLAAYCYVTWALPTTCSSATSKIVDQMSTWSGADCPSTCSTCCYYTVTGQSTSGSVTTITGTHGIPIGSFQLKQDLKFILTPTHGGEQCSVAASSVQESIFVIKDSGQDYCNLKNIMTGSSLATSATESVSGSSCTDLTEATC